MSKSMSEIFADGMWKEHPIFRQLLGMCPTMAITVTAANGLTMGLAVVFTLVFSCAAASLLRPYVSNQIRIAVYTVIIAAFVTIADLFLKAYFPDMSKALGAFIPLIIANCIILGRVEAFALRNALLPSVVDALGMGLGFAWGLTFLGAVRELLTAGSVFGVRILSEQFPTCLMIALPAGGFLVFGLLLAGMNELERRAKIRGGKA